VKITFTENAINKLKDYVSNDKKMLKLKYETEGCGCVVSGVPMLWVVREKDEDDEVLQTNFTPILVEPSKKVFFDEDLKIEFKNQFNSFQLSSPNQILNPRMALVEKS